MISEADLQSDVREITDSEVAFYEEHGWVKLDGLISPNLAAELLSTAQEMMAEVQETVQAGNPKGLETRPAVWGGDWHVFSDFHGQQKSDGGGASYIEREPFLSLAFDKHLARAGYRLINRAGLTDEVIPVHGGGGVWSCREGVKNSAGATTPYHQDWQAGGLDRIGAVAIWIALDEVTPEQGAMRFLDRSHQLGPLRSHCIDPLGRYIDEDLLEVYPKLTERYELLQPLHYKPGDATAHSSLTVHGAPRNMMPKRRWNFVTGYRSADCISRDSHSHAAEHDTPQRYREEVVYP